MPVKRDFEHQAAADYPPEWYSGEIQARIRERAHYTCEICGTRFDPVSNKAVDRTEKDGTPIFGHVHHLDHTPPNCDEANLMFLCQNCHIRLHGQNWKPGDVMPFSWGNEPPAWVLRRGLAYQLNPVVRSLEEMAAYTIDKQERARFIIQIIEHQGWIKGSYDPLAEMRGFLKTILGEYEGILNQRARETQQPILAAAGVWAAERGFLPYEEALARSGLNKLDFDMAVQAEVIQTEACPYTDPPVPAYFDAQKVCLSSEAIEALWATMRLTRQQAAELVGVPIPIFERKRHQAGFKPIGTYKAANGRYEPLYRRNDVEKLRR